MRGGRSPSNEISDISGMELETVRCVVRGIESNPEKRESTSTAVCSAQQFV
jgi:hypothetical protein